MKNLMSDLKHCDDYIHDSTAPKELRWFLLINRMPASDMMLARQFIVNPRLFADYKGKTVRVVMASRLGDVGITENLEAEDGYQKRVWLHELSNFTDVK